jgi:hypothetical protein
MSDADTLFLYVYDGQKEKIDMNNFLNDLLEADARKVTEQPTKKVEMKRLSKQLGKKMEVELTAVSPQRHAEIERQAIQIGKKGGVKDIDIFFLQVMTVIEGTVDPDLRDKKLLAKFGATTPKDMVTKLFLAGEIADLYNDINELSGYEREDEDEDAAVKN